MAAGHGLEGQRRDELHGALGHHDLHLGAALAQATHQVGALVGGDPAGDAEQDARGTGLVHGPIIPARVPGSKRP